MLPQLHDGRFPWRAELTGKFFRLATSACHRPCVMPVGDVSEVTSRVNKRTLQLTRPHLPPMIEQKLPYVAPVLLPHCLDSTGAAPLHLSQQFTTSCDKGTSEGTDGRRRSAVGRAIHRRRQPTDGRERPVRRALGLLYPYIRRWVNGQHVEHQGATEELSLCPELLVSTLSEEKINIRECPATEFRL